MEDWLSVEGVLSAINKTSEKVLDEAKFLNTETGCEMLEVIIDSVHRICNGYKDKKSCVPCKDMNVIFTKQSHHQLLSRPLVCSAADNDFTIRFKCFQQRKMFYEERRKKKTHKLRVGLTKNVFCIYRHIDCIKYYPFADYVIIDANLALKVLFLKGHNRFFDNLLI